MTSPDQASERATSGREVPVAPLSERAAPPGVIRIPAALLDWRALSIEDVDEILELIHRCEDADRTPYRTTVMEIDELFDPARPHAGYGGFAEDGQLVAHGFVRVRAGSENIVQAVGSGAVDPRWRARKIGSQLVEWQIDMARHLLAGSGLEGPAQILHIADEELVSMSSILQNNGFTERRSFARMRRDLAQPLAEFELGAHLTIERWSQGWAEPVRQAHSIVNSAGGGGSLTAEEWEREFPEMVPEWSFVAVDRATDRARLAGYVIGARYEDDWPMLGWREGYVDTLVVMGDWRHRGVGRGLLTASLRAFRDAGMAYGGIDLDSDEERSVHQLYRDLGFEPTHRSVLWAIDL
ncbi:MAG TPA: GNAT family N-acetyltransferase [Actinomycetaceae bacterium]|nr:GNAT family N-acetyltransferase [Actinomycetaceae bacterium]